MVQRVDGETLREWMAVCERVVVVDSRAREDYDQNHQDLLDQDLDLDLDLV
jgi:hypothetical protein